GIHTIMTASRAAILVLILSAPLAGASEPARTPNHDPDAARLVTSDLDNFLRAQTAANGAVPTAEVLEREYLDKGSPGLKDFLQRRINSAQNLAHEMAAHPKYYAALGRAAPRVAAMEPALRLSFRKLKELDDDAVFPDVYFLIGALNSGGTT